MAFFRNESFWLFTPLIMWIAGIFYFSSSKGSFSRNLPYFVPLLRLLFPRSDQVTLTNHYLCVRKLLHFFGYAVLGLLASIALYSSSLLFLATQWHLLSFAIVMAVAAVDEGRQCFNPDRVGSLSDVALDGVGGLTAILLFGIFALSFFR